MLKCLFSNNNFEKEKISSTGNDAMIDLRNDTNKKNSNKNKKPDQVINVIESILNFDKQRKVQALKYLKITNNTCTSKSRWYIRKFTEWN